MDTAVMPLFRRQRGSSSASCLAYNLGNFLRTLATPDPIKDWSLTTLKEKLIKIGAKVVSHGRYVAFQMAEVAIPRNLFADILRLICGRRRQPYRREALACFGSDQKPKEEVRLDDNKIHIFGARRANVTDLVHESRAQRNWHCQCPPKAAISAST